MRIIAGIARGRRLIAPEGDAIRPTSDKVRGAVFNSLKSKIDIEGLHVLDCFCGSGALGLEALSRGAAHCTFIDNARASLDLAKENAQHLKFENADFIFRDATKLKENRGEKASLAFLDSPYKKGLVLPALAALHAGAWLKQGAICVAETEKSFHGIFEKPFSVIDEKSYGDTKVWFLRHQ